MLCDLPPHRGAAHNIEIFMNTPGTEDEPTTRPPSRYIDPLDDVFGSAPASPVLASEDRSPSTEHTTGRALLEPSDIPRLRSTHVTNGYREGIAASKEQHIQEGFDEGYALGAELGLKVGWCLGALEGIVRAIPVGRATGSQAGNELGDRDEFLTRDHARQLLGEAEEELKMEKLFGEEYFGSDGIWLYSVPNQDDESEVTFEKIAGAHPIVYRWRERVLGLARDLGLPLEP